MTTEAKPDDAATDLAPVLEPTPHALAIAYGDREVFAAFFAAVVNETKIEADLDTKKGREEIASMAHKVARVKTKVDEFGKGLGEEARATLDGINATRNEYRRKLQDLQEQVRKPLDEWEDAQRLRNERMTQTIGQIRAFGIVTADMSAASICVRLTQLEAIAPTAELFGPRLGEAGAIYDDTHAALIKGHEMAEQREADARELQRLRDEAAKAQIERDAEAARQAEAQRARDAEAARVEAARLEEERLNALEEETRRRALQDAADIAEAERLEREQQAQAAEDARRAEAERLEAAHNAALQAERVRAEQAETALAAERERVAQAARQQAAADAARRADEAHRAAVVADAITDLMKCGLSAKQAADVAQAIADGHIRHTTITF